RAAAGPVCWGTVGGVAEVGGSPTATVGCELGISKGVYSGVGSVLGWDSEDTRGSPTGSVASSQRDRCRCPQLLPLEQGADDGILSQATAGSSAVATSSTPASIPTEGHDERAPRHPTGVIRCSAWSWSPSASPDPPVCRSRIPAVGDGSPNVLFTDRTGRTG